MVIFEPTGAMRAMVGGRDYGASQFNRATDALRQPGSSFKPFVYLTALETGKFKPTTIVVDAPICIGNWCPHNYKNSYMGSLPLMTALAHSLNTVAVRLSIAIGEADSVPGHNNTFEEAKRGRAKIIETARAMGLTTPLIDTVSLPIGADEVTVIDMASAYCTFANGRLRAPPYAAVEIANSRGEVIYRHDRDAPPLRRIVARRHHRDDGFDADAGGLGRHRHGARSSTTSKSPARPAPPTATRTPGSSASPAIMSAPSGSATTTTRRWTT